MKVNWKGVIPALMTEMHEDGGLDLDATARHIESCIKAGCNGFVMLGTLGENSSLSIDEKETVIRCAVEVTDGKVPVIAGMQNIPPISQTDQPRVWKKPAQQA